MEGQGLGGGGKPTLRVDVDIRVLRMRLIVPARGRLWLAVIAATPRDRELGL